MLIRTRWIARLIMLAIAVGGAYTVAKDWRGDVSDVEIDPHFQSTDTATPPATAAATPTRRTRATTTSAFA